MSLCIVKDNSESFTWYEYLISSKQTICEQRNFKSETQVFSNDSKMNPNESMFYLYMSENWEAGSFPQPHLLQAFEKWQFR